ncbi:hypothetical protein ACMFMG_012017 [Clarireedia jacksonii]
MKAQDQQVIFLNLSNGNTLESQNAIDSSSKDEFDEEENPYKTIGIGFKNLKVTVKPGNDNVEPWEDLKELPFVEFDKLKISKDEIVKIILVNGGNGRAVVKEFRRDSKDRIFVILMWAYSKEDVEEDVKKEWPDKSSYMLSNNMEVHMSEVMKDLIAREEVKEYCTTHCYFFSSKAPCIKEIGKASTLSRMGKYIRQVLPGTT